MIQPKRMRQAKYAVEPGNTNGCVLPVYPKKLTIYNSMH